MVRISLHQTLLRAYCSNKYTVYEGHINWLSCSFIISSSVLHTSACEMEYTAVKYIHFIEKAESYKLSDPYKIRYIHVHGLKDPYSS